MSTPGGQAVSGTQAYPWAATPQVVNGRNMENLNKGGDGGLYGSAWEQGCAGESGGYATGVFYVPTSKSRQTHHAYEWTRTLITRCWNPEIWLLIACTLGTSFCSSLSGTRETDRQTDTLTDDLTASQLEGRGVGRPEYSLHQNVNTSSLFSWSSSEHMTQM
jgi:hypothetical protein